MMSADLTTIVNSDLKTIKEQIEGVIKVMNTNHDAEEIIHMFKAIDKAYQKTYSKTVKESPTFQGSQQHRKNKVFP